jgi:hypothetical protein
MSAIKNPFVPRCYDCYRMQLLPPRLMPSHFAGTCSIKVTRCHLEIRDHQVDRLAKAIPKILPGQ